jgi:hypothetical protein
MRHRLAGKDLYRPHTSVESDGRSRDWDAQFLRLYCLFYTILIYDVRTGEAHPAQLLVAVLEASN